MISNNFWQNLLNTGCRYGGNLENLSKTELWCRISRKELKKLKIIKTLRTTKDKKNYCKVKILNFEFQY